MVKKTISAYEFLKKFPDSESARLHLERCRWPNGAICPKCSCSNNQYKQSRDGVRGYYHCYHCKITYTVRTGTIFERSHVPLDKWLFAMYLVVTSRKGISSIQLAKEIGITQKTAWFMLQRIRESCGNNNDDDGFLSGIVEADETYIGGKENNKHSNKKLKLDKNGMGKNIVFGMRQRNGKTRAIVICDMTSQTLKSYLNTNIDDRSILCTDKNRSYIGNKFTHRVVNHSVKQFVDGMAHTNSIESVWALLKRGFYGVYHQFSKKHLQRYINEFKYRLNEAHKEVHTLDGINRLIIKSFEKRLTYCVLVSN